MRKLSILLCLVLCFTLVVPAFSLAEEETITITITDWNEGLASEYQKAACQQYMDEHPGIIIDHQTIAYDDYHTKLNTLLAAGECPDIYYVSDMQAIEWGVNGVAADLKALYAADGIDMSEKFVSSALYQTSDAVYGLAYGVVDMVMYYNKDLYDAAGVAYPSSDALNPTSWADWVDGLKKITTDYSGKHPGEDGFNAMATATYGTLMPTWYYTMDALLASNNAAFFDENGYALDSDNAKEVVQAIYDLNVIDQVAPSSIAQSALPSVASMFEAGQLACYIGGSYEYPDIAAATPNLGIAALPCFEKPSTIAWAACCQIYKDTPHMEEVFDFFRWYVEADTNTCHLKSNMPNEYKYYQDESLTSVWLSPDDYIEEYRTLIPVQMSTEGLAKQPVMDQLKNSPQVCDEYLNPALQTVWLGEKTVDQMVEDLKVALDGIFQGVY